MLVASELLKKANPQIKGLNDTVLQPIYQWTRPYAGETYVQVIHVKNPCAHWITISNKGHLNDNVVDVYDSLHIAPSKETLRYISNFVKSRKSKIVVNVLNVTKQPNGTDCGVFAIAFATSLVLGTANPSSIKYVTGSAMRDHLANCFAKKEMCEFP